MTKASRAPLRAVLVLQLHSLLFSVLHKTQPWELSFFSQLNMAATIASLSMDPSKTARCPVTISEQLLREDGPRKRRRVNVQRISTTSSIENHVANRMHSQLQTKSPHFLDQINHHTLPGLIPKLQSLPNKHHQQRILPLQRNPTTFHIYSSNLRPNNPILYPLQNRHRIPLQPDEHTLK